MDVEGCGGGLISWHFSGGAEENTKTQNQYSRFPSPDLKEGPPEYEAKVLSAFFKFIYFLFSFLLSLCVICQLQIKLLTGQHNTEGRRQTFMP
jgi:hypothetical protein